MRPPPPIDALAPFIPWDAFDAGFRWEQGEHASFIGPTQTGKTTLALALVPRRHYVAILGTKREDPALSALLRQGWRRADALPRVRTVAGRRPDRQRVLVWPRLASAADKAPARAVHARVLDDAYAAGGWTIFADEASFLCRGARSLAAPLMDLWQQGATSRITLMAATQRPAWVPLDIYSAATHVFFWRTNDTTDLRRIGGLNGADDGTVRAIVQQLDAPSHEVLYLNTRTGDLIRTRFDRKLMT